MQNRIGKQKKWFGRAILPAVGIFLIVCFGCSGGKKAERERTPEIPYEAGYLESEIRQSARYTGPGSWAIMPIQVLAYRAEHHLIAFFDGHDEFESVEAFVFTEEIHPGEPEIRAILTRHDNSQIDYVNDPGWNADSDRYRKTAACHQTRFEFTNNEGRTVFLRFTRPETGEEISVRYVGNGVPEGKYGKLTDVGLHSPNAGLPLFFREESAVSAEGSTVTIDKQIYKVPQDRDISHPPFFIAYSAFFSNGYNSMILPTYSGTAPVLPTDGKDFVEFTAGPTVNHAELRRVGEVVEITSLRCESPDRSPGYTTDIRFNPGFPNIAAMQIGSTAETNFAIFFNEEKQDQVYGDIIVERLDETTAVVKFIPQYPGWARAQRAMRYQCTFDGHTIQVDAAMLSRSSQQ